MGDPRTSARTGGVVDLNVTFYRDGVPTDPFKIRHIDIYEGSEKPENLVAQIPIDPASGYPSPLIQETDSTGTPIPGFFILPFTVPTTFRAPQAYVDVWRFLADDPGSVGLGTEPAEIDEIDDDDDDIDEDDSELEPEIPLNWSSVSNKFFVFQDSFYGDDGLVVPRLGFEAMDKLFRKPEVRTLEVGMMPLPLYDFDFNRIAPLIPRLRATITIETDACEILVKDSPCRIGVRQGTYRANPFTVQYTLDTNAFLVGTYQYRITLYLPNGETRVSDPFRMSIY